MGFAAARRSTLQLPLGTDADLGFPRKLRFPVCCCGIELEKASIRPILPAKSQMNNSG